MHSGKEAFEGVKEKSGTTKTGFECTKTSRCQLKTDGFSAPDPSRFPARLWQAKTDFVADADFDAFVVSVRYGAKFLEPKSLVQAQARQARDAEFPSC